MSYTKSIPPKMAFIHPTFHTRLKVEAAMKGLSMIEYTKQLSGVKSLEEEFVTKRLEEKKKNGFPGFHF